MAKKVSQYAPDTEAFREKILEALKSDNKGLAIKKAVDELLADLELNVITFNRKDK